MTTIHNSTQCSVAGSITAGGICSHLLTTDTLDLTEREFIDMIKAQPDRVCVPVKGLNICSDDQSSGLAIHLPARGASILMFSDEWGEMKTELAMLCRMAGRKCKSWVQDMLEVKP